jgi:lysine decarboxylase
VDLPAGARREAAARADTATPSDSGSTGLRGASGSGDRAALGPSGSAAPGSHAPLAKAWAAARERRPLPFVIPGHKGRTDLAGPVVRDDVPLYGGLGSMRDAPAAVAAAERRAAELWGADLCRFGVAGSTQVNQAVALAVGRPGDRVVVTRGAHRSLLLGLVLAGLDPVWVRPDVDPVSGLPGRLPPERLAAGLAAHPDAVAAFVVEPGYGGARSDVRALAAVAHAAGVPLVVDQAWGAHLGFHAAVPPHALAEGADALVTSAHKALPAWTQAALLLARLDRIDGGRLVRGFEAGHTTSPSGTILASTDAALTVLAAQGASLLDRTLAAVASARDRLRLVPGLSVVDGPPDRFDPLRLVVGLAGSGADGLAVEADLDAAGFPVELADQDTLVATVSLADSPDTLEPFIDALAAAVERHRGSPRRVVVPAWAIGPLPEAALPPRAAFFADRETVAVERAAGRVSAELIAPYPPGIPAVVPGEVLDADLLAAVRDAASGGTRLAHAADPLLRTVDVVAGWTGP